MRDGTLEVFSEKVKDPKEVRYGWKNFLVGTLFNTFGLPASSFRSDNRE
jgi:sialate O-acetylesterase